MPARELTVPTATPEDGRALARSRLLALISHDLRAPLAAVSLVVQLLENTPCTPVQEQALRTLKSSTQELLQLADAVSEMARIQGGEIALRREEFDLRRLVRNAVRKSRSGIGEKQLTVVADVVADVPHRVVSDPVLLEQILCVLFDSAIRHTEDGTITLVAYAGEHAESALAIQWVLTGSSIEWDRANAAPDFERFLHVAPEVAFSYITPYLELVACEGLLRLCGSSLRAHRRPDSGSDLSFGLWMELPAA